MRGTAGQKSITQAAHKQNPKQRRKTDAEGEDEEEEPKRQEQRLFSSFAPRLAVLSSLLSSLRASLTLYSLSFPVADEENGKKWRRG